jgi:2-succinyl-6-hydroxy-2,4-cyclohexadiene-1-carboxylate synthase
MKQQVGTLEHDGETIYYEVTGEGEPVVLSHGAGGNHAIWFQQVLVLARQFKVVTWDQRSFGRTTNRAGAAGPATFAADLEALLDHLDITSAHLVGQSMGGWTTLRFAIDHPERVRSIVLADTPGGIMTAEVRHDVEQLGADALAADDLAAWEHPAIGPTTSREQPTTAFLYRQINSVSAPRDPKIAARLFEVDYADQASKIEVPVLLIVGEEDRLFTPQAIRSAAEVLQNARVLEISGSGHSPYFERPEPWNEAVLEFLDSIG